MVFEHKNVVVCGIARSGISSAMVLKKIKANVCMYDLNTNIQPKLLQKLEDNNIKFYLGENPSKNLMDKIDILIVSPGIPLDLEFIKYANEKNILMGEMELAYNLCKSQNIVAITGTNGKTTTTSLVGEILGEFKKTFVAGNIGLAFSEIITEIEKDDIVVIEASSFQLETIKQFKPKVCVVLNITPDHLNRHKTMDNYIKAKENIFKNILEDDFLILNYDDAICKNMAHKTKAKIMYFSTKVYNDIDKNSITTNIYLDGNFIYLNQNKFINTNEIKILGLHNLQNVMASILCGIAFGVNPTLIKKKVQNFKSIEHRIEYVCTRNLIDFYNDSKATNISATIMAINSMMKKTHIILGGSDKGEDFLELINTIKIHSKTIKSIVIIGDVSEKLKKMFDENLIHNYKMASSLKNATSLCYETAKSGECILLSPACASFDMFKNYEERGELFKKYSINFKE